MRCGRSHRRTRAATRAERYRASKIIPIYESFYEKRWQIPSANWS
jgi:hypothetical protein